MFTRLLHGVFVLLLLVFFTHTVFAQVLSIPSSGFGSFGTPTTGGLPVTLGLTSTEMLTNNLWAIRNGAHSQSPLESASGSVSKLDLKAPRKARREYEKGYRLLSLKDFKGATEHLEAAVSLYPSFVAAHNSLGSAYLSLGRNEEARDQFAKAVSLDDHLPASYLNLGCAQLSLKDYRSAESSMQKASSIAPLDLQLAMALTYTQFMNQDYSAVLETVREVHSRKHEGAAIVHFFAAAASDGQNHSQETQRELETLVREDPKSPAAEQAGQILAQLKVEQLRKDARKKQLLAAATANPPALTEAASRPTAEQLAAQHQIVLQDANEQKQVAEAEAAPDAPCAACSPSPSAAVSASAEPGSSLGAGRTDPADAPLTLRSTVEEVAVLFAATDHGRSVTDLNREEVGIRDDQKSPSAITGFRNEAQLPLRLGVVIDTSASTTRRFSFEQRAARDFLQKVLIGKDDLAFVVGVANSVLLVQDYTADQQGMSRAIDQLTPAGGTALWDAVSFAAGKLSSRPEIQPVARMLVVISDGKDNSSNVTLKEAIATAERGEVFVYTVSTREANEGGDLTITGERTTIGDRALKLLAERTGGADFMPGSITGLNHGLEQLQQVIRSRYLISYKPALLKHDGKYRSIDITAQKSGRKLRVYARRGYYAQLTASEQSNF